MKLIKNNIFIQITHSGIRDGKFDAWPETIPMGYLPNDEIIKYHQKLETTQIPKDSCLYNMYVQFFKKYITNAISNETPMEWDRRFEYRLHLEYCRPGKWAKCDVAYNPMAHCLENIKNGLCRDPYAIEIIGKTFFPEQYNIQRGKTL